MRLFFKKFRISSMHNEIVKRHRSHWVYFIRFILYKHIYIVFQKQHDFFIIIILISNENIWKQFKIRFWYVWKYKLKRVRQQIKWNYSNIKISGETLQTQSLEKASMLNLAVKIDNLVQKYYTYQIRLDFLYCYFRLPSKMYNWTTYKTHFFQIYSLRIINNIQNRLIKSRSSNEQ